MPSTWTVPPDQTYTRYLRDANGSLFEQLSTQPFTEDTIPAGMVEISQETYLAELEVLEDAHEDRDRHTLITNVLDAEEEHRSKVAGGMSDGAARRRTGHDPDNVEALLAAARAYTDPKRVTVRRTPYAEVA